MTNVGNVAHWYALLHEDGDEHAKARALGGEDIVASGLAGMQLAHPYLIFATILGW
jgi:hypothetical protein